jgi:hypothetical protein
VPGHDGGLTDTFHIQSYLAVSLGRQAPAPSSTPPLADKEDVPMMAPCLTVTEMAAKREKGKCYNCTEPFTWAHLEVCPMNGIYLLQMDDTILMSTASLLHLEPEACPSLHVTVANGDHVASAGICCFIHIFIDSEEFIINLFVIPLEGYDMVLGVQWLCTLKPILWDFERARMSCWCDDHRVIWQGMTGRRMVAVHAMEASDLMLVLLEEFKDVFMVPSGLPPPCHHNHRIHLLLTHRQ